jgi:hypothetical protein
MVDTGTEIVGERKAPTGVNARREAKDLPAFSDSSLRSE